MARILLVDDDPMLRKVLQATLEAQGYDIVGVDDGKAALKIFSPQKFDIVITDVVMPEMDGLEFILRLRKDHTSVPILALSGGGRSRNMEVLEHAGTFGATAVLPKPFLPEQLVQLIATLLKAKPK